LAEHHMAEFFTPKRLVPVDPDTRKRIQHIVRSHNITELITANIRNVLLCGASRSGKTTCFRVIQDPCYCPEKSSMFSESQTTTFKSFSLKNNIDGQVLNFVLNLIDTPGTFEIRAADQDFETRSNEKIGELIIECLDHNVTYLNMVVLFLGIAGGSISPRDVDSIHLFMKMFGGSGVPVILCLTHADRHNETKRKSICDEIKRYPRLTEYFKTTPEKPNPQLEILFMGCVDYNYDNIYDPAVMAQQYGDVENWRNIFIQRIFEAVSTTQLKNTNIYNTHKAKMSEVLKQCHMELLYLSEGPPESSEYQTRLKNNKPAMEYLFKNKMILMNDDSLVSEREKFWKVITSIKESADTKPDTKHQKKLK